MQATKAYESTLYLICCFLSYYNNSPRQNFSVQRFSTLLLFLRSFARSLHFPGFFHYLLLLPFTVQYTRSKILVKAFGKRFRFTHTSLCRILFIKFNGKNSISPIIIVRQKSKYQVKRNEIIFELSLTCRINREKSAAKLVFRRDGKNRAE